MVSWHWHPSFSISYQVQCCSSFISHILYCGNSVVSSSRTCIKNILNQQYLQHWDVVFLVCCVIVPVLVISVPEGAKQNFQWTYDTCWLHPSLLSQWNSVLFSFSYELLHFNLENTIITSWHLVTIWWHHSNTEYLFSWLVLISTS